MKNTKRVIKLSYPFERIKAVNKLPEVSLFKSVITQMIIDATNTSDNPKLKRLEQKAKKWLFGNSEDFKIVCSMASMSPSYVVKIAREIINVRGRGSNLAVSPAPTAQQKKVRDESESSLLGRVQVVTKKCLWLPFSRNRSNKVTVAKSKARLITTPTSCFRLG